MSEDLRMRADLSGVDELTRNLTHRIVVGDIPTRAAQTFGDRPAIVDGDRTVSFGELESLSNSVANALVERGMRRGDRLALHSRNRWQFVVTFFGCAKAGITVFPVNLMLTAADIAVQLAETRCAAAAVDSDLLEHFTEACDRAESLSVETVYAIDVDGGGASSAATATATAAAAYQVQPWETLLTHDGEVAEYLVDDRDPLHCLYTSGTTSRAKGVITSHLSAVVSALNSGMQLSMSPRTQASATPIVLPLFHVTALDAILMPTLLSGSTAVLLRGFDADAVIEAFCRYRVSHLTMLPMMWTALLDHPRIDDADTTHLRVGLYAMAPMPSSTLTALRSRFPNADIMLGSGQTETTPPSELQWPEHQGVKDDSWGAPTLMSDVRIMSTDGKLLPRHQEGEIVYRSPQLMDGYLDNAEANTHAFAHGWFHGGDIGYIDDEGVVWFTDRAKDIVKTGGENVSSVEVERALLGHPSVAECAVVGRSDPHWGEAVTAVVVIRDGHIADPDGIRAHCREVLAPFKVPKKIVVVDTLPKTATGKIRKHELRTAPTTDG